MEMSGGDGDVEPYLYSRNTIGHGNHNPKSQRPKRVKIDIGGSRERWWCLWKTLGVCGSKRGHRGKIGETMRKWRGGLELLLPGAGCPGRRTSGDSGGCPGSWIVDELDEHHEKKLQLRGKIRMNWWMEIAGEMGKS